MRIGEEGILVDVHIELEILSCMIFLSLILFVFKKYIKEKQEFERRIFLNGLKLKIFAAIVLPVIYIFYYKGGDTVTYFHDSMILQKLFWKDPMLYFDFLFNGMNERGTTTEWKAYFSVRQLTNDYFVFRLDDRAMFVVRIASVLTIITGGSFVASGILISIYCYVGLWKIYELFVEYYPLLKKQLSYTILFIPSVVFWGAGLLKDPITMGALCFLVFYFHSFMKRKKMLFSALWCIASGYLILGIKPYIFNAFIIGMGCWLLSNYLVKIKSIVLRALILPFLLSISMGIVYFSLDAFSDKTGQYSLENVMDEAVLIQNDLKQEYYGGHRFDIGEFEPTLTGVLSKAPIAIATTLFRPFVWEADNVFIMMSALESTVVMLFSFLAIFRIKLLRLQGVLLQNPLLFFSFIFSLFFAFSVGLTTANFGALVRYKIPLMPFYLSMVYILSNYSKIPVKSETSVVSKEIVV